MSGLSRSNDGRLVRRGGGEGRANVMDLDFELG